MPCGWPASRIASPASAGCSKRTEQLGAVACAAAAFVELVQLDHVAARIVHEDLRGVGAGEALDHPVLHAHAVELLARCHDVPDREGDVRPCRIFARPLGDHRRLLAADQVDLAHLADIDPGSRDAGNSRALLVAMQAQHVLVEALGGGELLRAGIDAHAGMVDFKDFNGHGWTLLHSWAYVCGMTRVRGRASSRNFLERWCHAEIPDPGVLYCRGLDGSAE